MQSFDDKKQNRQRTRAISDEQKRSSQAAAIHDRRPASSLQCKLENEIDSSPKQLAQKRGLQAMFGKPAQLQSVEDEELLLGKFEQIQRVEEDEELLQGKFEQVQRLEEDEELLQGKFDATPIQKQAQAPANNTGLPDTLKGGIEQLSGYSMDDVRVHYNSDKPGQLQAHAYAQGSNIHVAPGQEKHLPHEAWHVVQQKQGRVKPTMRMKAGVSINDDPGLESEATRMGEMALQRTNTSGTQTHTIQMGSTSEILQAKNYDATTNEIADRPAETQEIKASKDKAKLDAATLTHPINEFTAHHKYPWNKIKADIETAFEAPKTDSSEKALDNLESFSSKTLPTSRAAFLNSVSHRETTYGKKWTAFDKWIQEVCWVPANIFLGPLSDKRLDDPSKRPGDNDFDAHYKRTRRMSIRSEGLSDVFSKGGLSKESFHTSDNTVAPYTPSEWSEHDMSEGATLATPMYSQTQDPYFEENIFPYHVTSAATQQLAYTQDTYVLAISTPLDSTLKGARYCQKFLGNKPDKLKKAAVQLASTTTTKNWQITLKTPKQHIVQDVEIGLEKNSGKQKAIKLSGITLKRV